MRRAERGELYGKFTVFQDEIGVSIFRRTGMLLDDVSAFFNLTT